MVTKMVRIKTASPNGHDTQVLHAAEAAVALKEHIKCGRWAFIDGNMVSDAAEITEERVSAAEKISVTLVIMAG